MYLNKPMDVREIPQLVFSGLIENPIIKVQRDYAEELGYHDLNDYRDELVVAGQLNDKIFLRQGMTGFGTHLSVHSSLNAAIFSDSPFDSALCLMAGTRDTGSWSYGRGAHLRSDIWIWSGDNRYSGQEGLIKFKAISEASGVITSKAVELIETGQFDFTTYGSLDLSME